MIRDYFDTFLKGEVGLLDETPQVQYYIQGADSWGGAESWPVATDEAIFYLREQDQRSFQGVLQAEEPATPGAMCPTRPHTPKP